MTPNINYPKRHFVEIFADRLGFDLNVLSRPSVSNFHIACQIEEAILNKPDLVLFNITNSDRIEIDSSKKIEGDLTLKNIGDCIEGYGPITDIDKTMVISLNLSILRYGVDKNILKKYPDFIEKYEALKIYFRDLYNHQYKTKLDKMIMHSAICKLIESHVPFLVVHDYTKIDCKWVNDKNSICEVIENIRKHHTDLMFDPGWHLSFESTNQVAEILIEQYKIYKDHIYH